MVRRLVFAPVRPGSSVQRACLLAWSLLALGCQPATPPTAATTDAAGTPSAGNAVQVQVTDAAGFAQLLTSLRGRVVLVDFWATSCLPCVAQFPHTVQWHRKYADRGLAVISVSLDFPEDEPQVRAFLQEQGAHFDNLLCRDGMSSRTIEQFGLSGTIPHYRVYDRRGALRHEFDGNPAEQGIEPRMEELLAEPPPAT